MSSSPPTEPAPTEPAPTEPAPTEAAAAFGARLPLAVAYAGWLAGPAVERGLLGPREVPRLWERHLLNCVALADLLPPGAVVADIGSGAGLPGIVLAIARPDLRLTLVEPMARRAAFLRECAASLALPVDVVRARAEELHGNWSGDVATARAVAPLDRLLEWALPLVRPGGRVLAMKGERAEAELATARPALRRRGVAEARIVVLGACRVDPAARVVEVVRGEACAPASRTGRRRRRR